MTSKSCVGIRWKDGVNVKIRLDVEAEAKTAFDAGTVRAVKKLPATRFRQNPDQPNFDTNEFYTLSALRETVKGLFGNLPFFFQIARLLNFLFSKTCYIKAEEWGRSSIPLLKNIGCILGQKVLNFTTVRRGTGYG